MRNPLFGDIGTMFAKEKTIVNTNEPCGSITSLLPVLLSLSPDIFVRST